MRMPSKKLRQLSISHPTEVARAFSVNLEELAECTFVEREVTDADLRSELRAKMRLTAAQLAGDNPSTAVRMCAAAAVFAWADHWILNMQAGGAGVRKDDPASTRRRNAALKRYMTTLKTLAQIQKAERAKPRGPFDIEWPEVFGNRALISG